MAERINGIPRGLENFPARLLNQYYPPSEPARGFDILPLYSNDWYKYKIQRKYSLLDNECLKQKWKMFSCDPSMEKRLVFPTTKGDRFINQVARYQPPNEALGYCRAPLSLVPGPLVDEYGARPIPADQHYRYREKFRPAVSQKNKKKKTKPSVKFSEPTPPKQSTPPPLLCACPRPPPCECPPLPFACGCPPPPACTCLPPHPPAPPTPQIQDCKCTPPKTNSTPQKLPSPPPPPPQLPTPPPPPAPLIRDCKCTPPKNSQD